MTTTDDINDAFSALEVISEFSALNGKRGVLEGSASNPVLRTLLYCCYNPYLQYYIQQIPSAYPHGEGTSDGRYASFLMMLGDLSNHRITGNEARNTLKQFLTECSGDEYKWYSRVIRRDMRVGIAAKGINKAIPGLIPMYEVLLAEKLPASDLNLDTPHAIKMLPKYIITQHKIDGYRLNIHVMPDGSVDIRTRNGKVVSGYNQLEGVAAEGLPRGYVYDGEVVDPELYDWIDSNTGSSEVVANRDLFTSVMSHAFSKEDDKQGVFNMFDMVPMEEWKSHNTTEPYVDRVRRIKSDVLPLGLDSIVVVPSHGIYDRDNPDDRATIVSQFHQCLNVGWEGLMIKNADSPYEFKRSRNLLKMKLMDTLDLTVTQLFEGTGKYLGMMGGVYVDYKGYQVGVGSGWSDSQRRYYWDNPNDIVGKTIEVAYQAETHNKTGELSLSFPVVKGIRVDK